MTLPNDDRPSPDVLAALDQRHHESYAAYDNRDLMGYMDVFSPGLTWRGADGRTIDFDGLKRQVARQFASGI